MGTYTDTSANSQPMEAAATGGTWGQAAKISAPADAKIQPGGLDLLDVSCASVSDCDAVGYYLDTSNNQQAMQATASGGTWGQATKVSSPPDAESNPNAQLDSVSCTAPTDCVGVGWYLGSSGGPQGMATGEASPVAGEPYHPVSPARIRDTRPVQPGTAANQCNNNGAGSGTLGPGQSLSFQVTGEGGVPASGVSAVVLNVTVTDTTAASFLTVWPDGVGRPLASNLNWSPGETTPNAVEVPVGSDGKVAVFNHAGATDVVVDVSGYVGPGSAGVGLYNPLAPSRICDTRPVQPGTAANPCNHNGTSPGTLAGGRA